MLGATLAHELKRLEYFGGELFADGNKTECKIFCNETDGLVYAVCAHEDINRNFINV